MNHLLSMKKECGLRDADVLGDLLQPCDAGRDYVTGDNNYVWLYLLGKLVRPRSIVETGTRFGYSLLSFMSGSGIHPKHCSIWCCDDDSDGIDSLTVFNRYFLNTLMVRDLTRVCRDTAAVSDTGVRDADLAFVDALHTADGCYHECRLLWKSLRSGGVLVIDDIDNDDVLQGALRFLREIGRLPWHIPSLRGLYVLQKG